MRRRRRGRTADIDITPLIDVLFMLIIFFVLTASFVQGRITVDLPQGKSAPAEGGSVVVTVEKDGAILWGGQGASMSELPLLAKSAGAKEILIAGDKDAPYGVVAEVLDTLRNAGVESAGLLTQGGK
jgi:biopolymer transport protein ExbD